MKILKTISTDDVEIVVRRVEEQEITTTTKEQTLDVQTSLAWPKKADYSKGAKYDAKNINIPTDQGIDINFGIAITKSIR